MKKDILKTLAKEIQNSIFYPLYSYKTKIFLCGASLEDSESVRYKIDSIFKGIYPLSSSFQIVYPEDIFDELLSGPAQESLLSLENMLVESVDVVIVIPESPGSFTELGAFVNNNRLRKKIIYLQDEKRKKHKSFINYGPLRLIKTSKQGKVITIDYSDLPTIPRGISEKKEFFHLDRHKEIYESKPIKKLRKTIRAFKRDPFYRKEKLNLLDAEYFILPSIFILEYAQQEELTQMFMAVSGYKFGEARAATKAAINVLGKKKLISQTSLGYKITSEGLDYFWKQGEKGRNSSVYNLNALDDIRLEVLTWKNRGKNPFSNKNYKGGALSVSP